MATDSHHSRKETNPRRTLVFSILLLASTLLLAVEMSNSRTQDPLGSHITPDGWNVSIKAPRQFVPGETIQTQPGVALLFQRSPGFGTRATLAFWKVGSGVMNSAEEACQALLGEPGTPWLRNPINAATLHGPRHLGRARAVERSNRRRSRVVRAVLLPSTETYALMLITDNESTPIDDELYQLFDRACRSVEFSEN